MIQLEQLATEISEIENLGLVTKEEVAEVLALSRACFPLVDAVRLADSIHLNVKVEDIGIVDHAWVERKKARRENEKPGYVKYALPGGVNLILSAIPISQEDLREAQENSWRPRPFLDHIGIDLRQETAPVRELFNAIPYLCSTAGWKYISQGEPGKPVFCCHVQVTAKHWVFPSGSRTIPLEFAFGPLVINELQSGCDLRPANPYKTDGLAVVSDCCGG